MMKIYSFFAIIIKLLLTTSVVFFCFSLYHQRRFVTTWTKTAEKLHPKTVSPKGVIILTNYRSGSTFFGQLFNQHPDVFYTFEPLVLSTDDDKDLQLKLLKAALTCQFDDVSSIINKTDQLSLTLRMCLKENVCFRSKLKNLCSVALCGAGKATTCSGCGRIPTNTLRDTCSAKSISVAKVIRLRHLETVKELLEDELLDIKVIHLIRDPRGISSSRGQLAHDTHMRYTCNKIQHNMLLGMQAEWLRGKYKLVRYEDVARNPLQMAEKILQFLGLDMTPSILSWIQTDTTGDVFSSNDIRANKLKLKGAKKKSNMPRKDLNSIILRDAYSTVRDSNATWRAWRKSMDYSTIEEIQKDCKEVMGLLGYNRVLNNTKVNEELLSPITSIRENAIFT